MRTNKYRYNFAKIASWNINGIYYKTNNFKLNKLEDIHPLEIIFHLKNGEPTSKIF